MKLFSKLNKHYKKNKIKFTMNLIKKKIKIENTVLLLLFY